MIVHRTHSGRRPCDPFRFFQFRVISHFTAEYNLISRSHDLDIVSIHQRISPKGFL